MMKRIYLFTFLLLCAAPAYAVAPFGLLGGSGRTAAVSLYSFA